jgi:hypothetical protein
MAAGEAFGYLGLGAAGVPAATPYLRQHFRKWVSIELAFYAVHMQPGLAEAVPS